MTDYPMNPGRRDEAEPDTFRETFTPSRCQPHPQRAGPCR